jgi:hypothetical protein
MSGPTSWVRCIGEDKRREGRRPASSGRWTTLPCRRCDPFRCALRESLPNAYSRWSHQSDPRKVVRHGPRVQVLWTTPQRRSCRQSIEPGRRKVRIGDRPLHCLIEFGAQDKSKNCFFDFFAYHRRVCLYQTRVRAAAHQRSLCVILRITVRKPAGVFFAHRVERYFAGVVIVRPARDQLP